MISQIGEIIAGVEHLTMIGQRLIQPTVAVLVQFALELTRELYQSRQVGLRLELEGTRMHFASLEHHLAPAVRIGNSNWNQFVVIIIIG